MINTDSDLAIAKQAIRNIRMRHKVSKMLGRLGYCQLNKDGTQLKVMVDSLFVPASARANLATDLLALAENQTWLGTQQSSSVVITVTLPDGIKNQLLLGTALLEIGLLLKKHQGN